MDKPPMFTMHMDQKCRRCGHRGVAEKTGLCMSCIADDIAKRVKPKNTKEPPAGGEKP